jgi:deoxyribonuclease-1
VYISSKKFPYKSLLTLQLGMIESPNKGNKYVARGQKIEWEHIVPASWFTTVNKEIYDAWFNGDEKCITSTGTTYKSRKCAEKVSELFNQMESDMYNLVPVIGALNAMRLDKPYGIIDGEVREFGETIDVEITSKIFEVMPSKRGNVARVMLYMNKKYGIQFPDHNNTIEMLHNWDVNDPEDDWETQKKQILKDTYGMEF